MPHQQFMQRCFQLARVGLGSVAPNPLVGCIIVHEGKIIGEGYHQKFGEPHAEVNAINSVETQNIASLQNSTLYVNLEPCSHFGKTPPCADLIIEKKIPRVVIANLDPNPLVAGSGIKKLKQAGIEVITDVLKEEGLELNKRFFTFHTKKRPYIILKWAQSADGFLTKENDKQYWITGEPSRKTVHRWRSEEKGVLVGKNTVMIDNSKLNNRYFDIQKQPVRMIIDRGLEVADDFNVYDNSMRTIIFNNKTNKEANHTIWVKIPFEKVPQEICDELYKRNIQSLMVEGGAKTLQSFIEQNLWDEARIFTGKIKFETGIVAPVIQGNIISEEMLDNDKLQIVKNNITTLS